MGLQKGKKQTATFLWDIGGSGDSAVATGVIQMVSLPASSLVYSVRAHVQTAVTGSTAEECGDGTDVDGYLVDNFAAATGVYPSGAEDVTCGAMQKGTLAGATDPLDVSNSEKKKFYSAADTVDFKITGTATAGKIRFYVDFEVLY